MSSLGLHTAGPVTAKDYPSNKLGILWESLWVGTWLGAEVTEALIPLRYEPEGAATSSRSFKSWRLLQIGMPLALVSVSSVLLAVRHHPSSTQARRVRAGGKQGVTFHTLACLCHEEVRVAQPPSGNILKLLVSRLRPTCNPGESRCKRGARPGGFSLKPGGELRIEEEK